MEACHNLEPVTSLCPTHATQLSPIQSDPSHLEPSDDVTNECPQSQQQAPPPPLPSSASFSIMLITRELNTLKDKLRSIKRDLAILKRMPTRCLPVETQCQFSHELKNLRQEVSSIRSYLAPLSSPSIAPSNFSPPTVPPSWSPTYSNPRAGKLQRSNSHNLQLSRFKELYVTSIWITYLKLVPILLLWLNTGSGPTSFICYKTFILPMRASAAPTIDWTKTLTWSGDVVEWASFGRNLSEYHLLHLSPQIDCVP